MSSVSGTTPITQPGPKAASGATHVATSAAGASSATAKLPPSVLLGPPNIQISPVPAASGYAPPGISLSTLKQASQAQPAGVPPPAALPSGTFPAPVPFPGPVPFFQPGYPLPFPMGAAAPSPSLPPLPGPMPLLASVYQGLSREASLSAGRRLVEATLGTGGHGCRPGGAPAEREASAGGSPSDPPGAAGSRQGAAPSGSPGTGIPDRVVFRYCLEGTWSRAEFLAGVAGRVPPEELRRFGARVSEYTGCTHNGRQVEMAADLLASEERLWQGFVREAERLQQQQQKEPGVQASSATPGRGKQPLPTTPPPQQQQAKEDLRSTSAKEEAGEEPGSGQQGGATSQKLCGGGEAGQLPLPPARVLEEAALLAGEEEGSLGSSQRSFADEMGGAAAEGDEGASRERGSGQEEGRGAPKEERCDPGAVPEQQSRQLDREGVQPAGPAGGPLRTPEPAGQQQRQQQQQGSAQSQQLQVGRGTAMASQGLLLPPFGPGAGVLFPLAGAARGAVVPWGVVQAALEEQFLALVGTRDRRLTHKDWDFMARLIGCHAAVVDAQPAPAPQPIHPAPSTAAADRAPLSAALPVALLAQQGPPSVLLPSAAASGAPLRPNAWRSGAATVAPAAGPVALADTAPASDAPSAAPPAAAAAALAPAPQAAAHSLGPAPPSFAVPLSPPPAAMAAVTREQWEVLWRWLFPLAATLALPRVRAAWTSQVPMYVLGCVGREEAEAMLRDRAEAMKTDYTGYVQRWVGLFLLRYNAHHVWPHPDAGTLVASFVARGDVVQHKILPLEALMTKGIPDVIKNDPDLTSLFTPPPALKWWEHRNVRPNATAEAPFPGHSPRSPPSASAAHGSSSSSASREGRGASSVAGLGSRSGGQGSGKRQRGAATQAAPGSTAAPANSAGSGSGDPNGGGVPGLMARSVRQHGTPGIKHGPPGDVGRSRVVGIGNGRRGVHTSAAPHTMYAPVSFAAGQAHANAAQRSAAGAPDHRVPWDMQQRGAQPHMPQVQSFATQGNALSAHMGSSAGMRLGAASAPHPGWMPPGAAHVQIQMPGMPPTLSSIGLGAWAAASGQPDALSFHSHVQLQGPHAAGGQNGVGLVAGPSGGGSGGSFPFHAESHASGEGLQGRSRGTGLALPTEGQGKLNQKANHRVNSVKSVPVAR